MKELYGDDFIYQIGFTCSSKKYTKAYKSFDNINTNNVFIINPKELVEASAIEFVTNNYNYFNEIKSHTTLLRFSTS